MLDATLCMQLNGHGEDAELPVLYTLAPSQASSGLYPFLEWVAALSPCKPPSATGLDTVFLFRQCSRVLCTLLAAQVNQMATRRLRALVLVHGP
jgi:hypothetical protein